MISVCSVTLDILASVEEIYLDSLLNKSKVVNEVILAHNDRPKGYYEERNFNGITVKTFGTGIQETSSYGHALGLHYALDRATNDHVLLCDIDVFFCKPVDEIFLNLMKVYGLFAVGVSIDCPPILAQTFFPFVQCVLLRKSLLPGPDFLADCERIEGLRADRLGHVPPVPLNGKFLLPGPVKEHWQEFPNPTGSFDTSCNLWLWCKQQGGKWLSFQTMDQHTYCLNLYRTNFKLKEKLDKTESKLKEKFCDKLLYHVISATAKLSENPYLIKDYRDVWEKIKNEV